MDEELFINRKTELAFLSEWLAACGKSPKVLLVRAKTGFGKTRLVSRVLKSAQLPVVRLEVIDYPDYQPDDGDYLLRIFRALAQLSSCDSRILNIDEYLALRLGGAMMKKVAGVAAKHAALHFGKKLLGEEGVEALKEVLASEFKGFRSLSGGWPESIKEEIISYLGAVFSSTPCVLRIESIHKIDRPSLEYLRTAFLQYEGLAGVFEYTVGSNGALPWEAVYSALATEKVDCCVYDLQHMPADELVRGLKDRPDILVSNVVRHYQAQDFNLRVIVDVQVLADRIANSNERDNDEQASIGEMAIRSLSNPQRLLLALLVAHGAEVELEVLGSALATQQVRTPALKVLLDFRREIQALEGTYLAVQGRNVRIAHDSVIATFIKDGQNTKFRLIAGSVWEHFYREVLDRGDRFLAADAMHWLPILYLESRQTEQLVWILEQHGRSALGSFAPGRLVKMFQDIRDQSSRLTMTTTASRLDTLIERQGTVLFDTCLLDEACECLGQATKLSLGARMIYADACVATDHFDTGMEILDELEREYAADDRRCRAVRLRTGLIRVHALRTEGSLQQAENLYRDLLTWEDFHDDPVYASVLRCADIGLYKDQDAPECIALLEQAVTLSQRHGWLADEAAARVALCQHFGYQGELARARAELLRADELSQSVWVERYSILNNQAVLALMAGEERDGAALLLSQAIMLATEDGDRLLLLSNSLASGNASAADELVRLVHSIPDLSDELAKIAHYNLSVYFREKGDQFQAQFHHDEAASRPDEMDEEFWACTLRGAKNSSPAMNYRLKSGYYLVFIVHWRLTSMTFQGVDE